MVEAAFAARQYEQRVDEALLVLPFGQDVVAGCAEGVEGGVGIGEGHLQQRPRDGERGAQLMRGVCDEAPLGVERRFQPCE
jgi:hypothetical protein